MEGRPSSHYPPGPLRTRIDQALAAAGADSTENDHEKVQ